MPFIALKSTPENFGEQRRVQLSTERLKILKCFAGDLITVKSRKSQKVSRKKQPRLETYT
jgi:hypothetical protein